MAIFRVFIEGSNFTLENEDSTEECGFFRNEYVWAWSERSAVEKAKRNVRRLLLKKVGVALIDSAPLRLDIDTVESGYSLRSLLAKEGFIFFVAD
jgi:hypothetical protein